MGALELRLAVGERVRNYRLSNHYTQAYFAEMIDISVNFLSEIENGKKGCHRKPYISSANTFVCPQITSCSAKSPPPANLSPPRVFPIWPRP